MNTTTKTTGTPANTGLSHVPAQFEINLNNFDLIIVNSSAGKDSLCSIFEICRLATEQNFPFSKIHISHQELGEAEWKDTSALVQKQADLFGLPVHYSRRRNAEGVEETLLQYAERRGMFPSNKQRWCTSDFKRNVGARLVTALTKGLGDCKVLHVFGFRSDESAARKKKEVFTVNEKLTTNKRQVFDFLPIHHWSTMQVWKTIKENKLPYHFAYDLGMPRLSCCFCIFSPLDALVIAGKHNPELLQKYVEVEERIGHSFKADLSLKTVQEKIAAGYEPTNIADWSM